MHTRRKFLIQGSIATTAMLALKPLETFASRLSGITGFNSYGKLTLFHTSITDHKSNHAVIQQIANMRRNNAIVLQAGKVTKQLEAVPLMYDSSVAEINDQVAPNGGYKIISKGNIKTGIISASPEDGDVIQKVNTLSAWLKKEKGCTVVVCLSQLGYDNKNATDDITLAVKSIYVDLIIGGNTKNYHQHPVILLNKNNEEVIIHAAANTDAAFGKIDIEFNERGLKKHISFSNKV